MLRLVPCVKPVDCPSQSGAVFLRDWRAAEVCVPQMKALHGVMYRSEQYALCLCASECRLAAQPHDVRTFP